jgi:flagellar hook-basal body complex protein FliE
MSAIPPLGPAATSVFTPLPSVSRTAPARSPAAAGSDDRAPAQASFGATLDRLVGTIDAKQSEAEATTRRVLLGEGAGLHQSVIAMQEASVALSLMVEVRNKVIDSYQEIMHMPV